MTSLANNRVSGITFLLSKAFVMPQLRVHDVRTSLGSEFFACCVPEYIP